MSGNSWLLISHNKDRFQFLSRRTERSQPSPREWMEESKLNIGCIRFLKISKDSMSFAHSNRSRGVARLASRASEFRVLGVRHVEGCEIRQNGKSSIRFFFEASPHPSWAFSSLLGTVCQNFSNYSAGIIHRLLYAAGAHCAGGSQGLRQLFISHSFSIKE
jgi:hypothetical protein